jgi:hypothetical protein
VAVVAIALAAIVVGSGCRTPGGPAADTARVTVDDRTLTMELEDCGRDGETVFVLAEGDGAVLQLVVEVEASTDGDGEGDGEGSGGEGDESEGDGDAVERPAVRHDGVGLSLVFENGDAIGAFGEETADRAGVRGGATGSVDSARLDGSRIRVGVETEVLDGSNRGTGERGGRVTVDANCPDPDDLEAAGEGDQVPSAT